MKEEIICGIYKITSPTGRIYIGQAKDMISRWKTYKQLNSKTKRQTRLYRSLVKYTVENHTFEITEECPIEDLNCRERYWQDFYDVLNGGLNCILQECGEKRREFSEGSLQKRELIVPRTISEEEKEATRIRMLGNTYNTGRVRPEIEKEKISKTMKLLGIQAKENNSMWGKFGENNPNSKLILDTQTGIFYYGIKEASVAACIPYSSLKKIMCGDRINKTSLIYV